MPATPMISVAMITLPTLRGLKNDPIVTGCPLAMSSTRRDRRNDRSATTQQHDQPRRARGSWRHRRVLVEYSKPPSRTRNGNVVGRHANAIRRDRASTATISAYMSAGTISATALGELVPCPRESVADVKGLRPPKPGRPRAGNHLGAADSHLQADNLLEAAGNHLEAGPNIRAPHRAVAADIRKVHRDAAGNPRRAVVVGSRAPVVVAVVGSRLPVVAVVGNSPEAGVAAQSWDLSGASALPTAASRWC